ncbi:hypothetical protein JX265_005517 [Neoarthrinium moseri]|uniref:Carboxylesterase type B domain-containing protein n=1 Tax=Neoarthrinium moseri TaxID=1658444 RepID=A0A9P9WPB0_9PEZI|nr:hypothetical protein JX265_005517 [Neoarthrinium moseri]
MKQPPRRAIGRPTYKKRFRAQGLAHAGEHSALAVPKSAGPTAGGDGEPQAQQQQPERDEGGITMPSTETPSVAGIDEAAMAPVRTRRSRASPTAILAMPLRGLHRRLRPWHLFVALGAAAVAMVLSIVLVHVRDQQRMAALIAVQVDEMGPGKVMPFAMLGSLLLYASVAAAALTRHHEQTPSDPSKARVNLGYAQYQGTVLGNGVGQYLGLRYARAPTGDLRWRAPVEPETIGGDQAADSFGKICLGISTSLPSNSEGTDCLFANVWSPANATAGSKLPVWLFIQGGGYTVNSNANYNGSQVVESSGGNIIFVNFNYRVGLWGFLASERMRTGADLNVGLLDQRMMMKWVKKHIAQFGGDPDHVVIHGVSAGAGSVALHMAAYGGKDEGLFQGAVASSVFFPAQPRVSDLEWQFDLVLSQTGCSDAEDPLACLRCQDEETLQAANVPSAFPGRPSTGLPLFYWTPSVDGDLIRDYPYVMFANGDFIDVPVIFGTDTNEGSYFGANASTEEEVAVFLQNNYPLLTTNETDKILEQYPLMDPLPLHNAWFPSASMAYGESTFICPSVHILDSLQTYGQGASRAWSYRYDVLSPENAAAGLGVPHTWETWAIFGPDSINGIGMGPPSYYGADAAIVPVVMDYLISFVQTLDPNADRFPAAPEWSTWGVSEQRLRFDTGNVSMEKIPEDLKSRCDLWKDLATITQQ